MRAYVETTRPKPSAPRASATWRTPVWFVRKRVQVAAHGSLSTVEPPARSDRRGLGVGRESCVTHASSPQRTTERGKRPWQGGEQSTAPLDANRPPVSATPPRPASARRASTGSKQCGTLPVDELLSAVRSPSRAFPLWPPVGERLHHQISPVWSSLTPEVPVATDSTPPAHPRPQQRCCGPWPLP